MTLKETSDEIRKDSETLQSIGTLVLFTTMVSFAFLTYVLFVIFPPIILVLGITNIIQKMVLFALFWYVEYKLSKDIGRIIGVLYSSFLIISIYKKEKNKNG